MGAPQPTRSAMAKCRRGILLSRLFKTFEREASEAKDCTHVMTHR